MRLNNFADRAEALFIYAADCVEVVGGRCFSSYRWLNRVMQLTSCAQHTAMNTLECAQQQRLLFSMSPIKIINLATGKYCAKQDDSRDYKPDQLLHLNSND